MIKKKSLKFSTKGNCDIINISDDIADALSSSGLRDGTVTVFCVGSTGGIMTCEYEPGLAADIKDFFQKIIPQNKSYKHDETWGDANGHSHLRASLLGSSVSVPFIDKKLVLGTWQQVVFIDFDNRPRSREVILQFIGEPR
ncbi:MAG TPA: YjbQ family protein [Candidatus Omnitrophica bacterium]|nr:YjbQ family protein [Candidatus Omnitrophota bacterium]